MPTLSLPTKDRSFAPYTTGEPIEFPSPAATKSFNRIAYAAAHVVADPLADIDPWLDTAIDWERTIAFRHYLWDLGLGVAEAMDTAQRGGGLDWPGARELIRRALDAAKSRPGVKICCGVGTDHLDAGADVSIDDIIRAYEEQIEAIEAMGGQLVLMASRALARAAQKSRRLRARLRPHPAPAEAAGDHPLARRDVRSGARRLLGQRRSRRAMESCLGVIRDNAAKIDGVKISLLSKDKEIAMRRRLPAGVRMYTGDDFNYAELIAGDEQGYSDALLGIFDAIAPAASAGLARLATGDLQGFHGILEPTVPLSRHIFKAPTRFYKTGVVFLAWLNGLQDHFIMVGGQESARSLLHLAELFRLADKARVLHDPDRAAARMRSLLAVHGFA